MLDAVIRWSILNRAVVLLGAVAMLVVGTVSLGHARFDVLPDFTPARVVVQTEAPGMGTPDVEAFVTTPLERVLLGTPEATSVRSQSAPGLSVVTLMFDDDTDLFRARQLVGERLALATDRLPRGADQPRIAPISAPIGALIKLCVTAAAPDDASLRAVRTWGEFTLAPRLLSIAGVAGVTVHGGQLARIEVRPDPVRLRETGLWLDDLVDAVRGSAVVGGAGFVESGPARLDVQADARLDPDTATSDLRDTWLASRGGLPVRIGDVAWVGVASEPPVGAASFDGKPAIYVQVTKLPWADTLATTDAVEAAIAELAPTAPPGAVVEAPVFRQASFIRTSLRSLTRAMALGAGLVVAVLIAFLRSPRLAVISLTAIPLSILGAATALVAVGMPLDGMVLGGLAIAVGEVVDDAIVDVENVWRRLRLNAGGVAPRDALHVVRDASIEVRASVVYATVIVGVVLVPILFMSGVAGRIFAPLAEAYLLAIGASLAVALTVTPALCALLLPQVATADARPTRLSSWLLARYRAVLARVVQRPRVVTVTTAVLTVVPVLVLPFLGGRFLPEFHEGSLIAHVLAVPGTSLPETERLAAAVAAAALAEPAPAPSLLHDPVGWLTTTPEVRTAHVAARVGRASLDDDAAPVHRIEMDFLLPEDFSGEWGFAVADVAKRIGQVTGLGFVVEGFLGERIHEVLSGETAPVVVEVYGSDLDTLRSVADQVAAIMAQVPGLGAVRPDPQVDVPQLRIRPDRGALAKAGVRPADLLDQVVRWRQGAPGAQALGRDGRVIEVVVAGPPELRDEEALRDLPIRGASGVWWPLSSLARIDVVPAPASVAHDGGLPVIHIAASAPGAGLSRAVGRLRRALDALALPSGYRVEIGGESAARSGAAGELLVIGGLVLLGVFVLLASVFRSMGDAAIVLLNLPLGLLGGVLAALSLPEGLSVAGFVGFVTLFGICARNGILLVAHTRHLDVERPDLSPVDRALLAAEERLLPILMTAATAGLALLPLALSGESAGSELESPMAVIVCGGLLTSTTLNLLVLPTIFVWRARARA